MTLRLDGRVAVVTGAGAGLGRQHALLLARQGAKVVVNDLGGSTSGVGSDSAAADKVVAEIKVEGGTAVPNYESVSTQESAERIIKTAVDAFGKIDILINNAGILRDKSFGKSDLKDFAEVFQVHYWGTVFCTKAAWGPMSEQKYGRVVFTTSVAGTSGNFGQSNYGSAKAGMLGLMNCLAIEGRKNNVLVNAISPGALTRMTDNLGLDESFMKKLDPAFVSPAVAWLASERCDVTATIITAAAGGFGRLHFFETKGVQFDPSQPITVELFDRAFDRINDLSTADPTTPGTEGRMQERLDTLAKPAA
ncbi:SDR family NAD(P)-dependent oxidoreductase [Kumtagia ephedrae]|uniref:Serine/threonine protein kinase n=1 Tax=Kumtagia ephedrae TaxID=2116701 RepID=A0A2P7SRW4_9HYPH|nr:SDR family NAD(P)-dependent oxidoreductase [Mesorhizobium ephedrae]PSJ65224.1 serine/threonine protein kinase [Mesorhizobium ephedrae]